MLFSKCKLIKAYTRADLQRMQNIAGTIELTSIFLLGIALGVSIVLSIFLLLKP